MTLAEVLDHLRRRGATVVSTRTGADVTCFAHEDRRPSLHLTTGREGRVLGVCRAGCRAEEWTAAAGLRLADLFATPPTPIPRRRRPSSPLAQARAEALDLARRQAWARVVERYEAADLIRRADQLRARHTGPPTDDERVWSRLAEAARVTTLAENVLAGGEQ